MADVAKIEQLLNSIGSIQDPVSKKMISVEEKDRIITSILNRLEENQLTGQGILSSY
jgi:hypothetical protein